MLQTVGGTVRLLSRHWILRRAPLTFGEMGKAAKNVRVSSHLASRRDETAQHRETGKYTFTRGTIDILESLQLLQHVACKNCI